MPCIVFRVRALAFPNGLGVIHRLSRVTITKGEKRNTIYYVPRSLCPLKENITLCHRDVAATTDYVNSKQKPN
jgi:hypothetical protein